MITHLGKDYNTEPEMVRMRAAVQEAQSKNASLSDLMKPHNRRPFVIAILLMVFQQLSGVNAILFNLNDIFEV